MTKFLKNLTLCCLATTVFITSSQAVCSKTLKQVEQMNTETITFVDNLNIALPQIIKEISSSKLKLNATMLKAILNTYDVKVFELIKVMLPLKKNNLNDRLLPLAGSLAIEALLIASISNLKKQKDSDKKSKLNKKIDGYIKEIREKALILRATLNDSLIKYLGVPNNLNLLDPTKGSKVTPTIKKILEECHYKQIPELLKVKSKKLKKEFFDSVEKTAAGLLTPADQVNLNAFIQGPTFQKMEKATTAQTFTTFSGKILSSLPASAQNLITQAKTTILVNAI